MQCDCAILMDFPLRISFFNVSGFSNLRADAHSDPLHWCLPGVVDYWNKLMLLYLAGVVS